MSLASLIALTGHEQSMGDFEMKIRFALSGHMTLARRRSSLDSRALLRTTRNNFLHERFEPRMAAHVVKLRLYFQKHQKPVALLIRFFQPAKCLLFVAEDGVDFSYRFRRRGVVSIQLLGQFKPLLPIGFPT